MGADDNILSNLFLPFGKVRMGYPTGEARWGLMTIFKVVTTIGLELSLNFISFVVYPCLSLDVFYELVTSVATIC